MALVLNTLIYTNNQLINMRNIFILTILSIFFCSCKDDRFVFFTDVNNAPGLKIYSGTQNNKSNEQIFITDSIKLSLKHSQQFYNFGLVLSDNEKNLSTVTYNYLTGGGEVKMNNKVLSNNMISFDNSVNSQFIDLSFIPNQLGTHRIQLSARDTLEATKSATLELIAFDNVSPKANLSVKSRAVNDPNEYTFDASKSIDYDSRFGGGIYFYEFIVNGTVFKTDKPSLNYIFNKAGSYKVAVQVTDNDNAVSAQKDTTIIIK